MLSTEISDERSSSARDDNMNRYHGNVKYYVFWWEGKTVQKKALTKILAETLAPLLLGIDRQVCINSYMVIESRNEFYSV
jgi:hypothetical protein